VPVERKKSLWNALLGRLDDLDRKEVMVGWRDPEAARIALINDRGGDRGNNPPARPVLGPAVDAVADEVRKLQAKAASWSLRNRRGDVSAEIGELLVESVRREIEAVRPANAASTIASKGFDGPLRGPSGQDPDGGGDRLWRRREWWEQEATGESRVP
jgi:hypothetical protein